VGTDSPVRCGSVNGPGSRTLDHDGHRCDTCTVNEQFEVLKLDYEQTLATYRQLTGIRFKLLAFVPAISGAAIAVLGQTNPDRWARFGFAVLGFFVTLGIVLYDQRNTQFYNGAMARAKHLERELRFKRFENDKNVGLFGSRRSHPKQYLFGLPVGHDLGLALVYSTVLGAWVFAAIEGGWPTKTVLAATLGIAVAVAALVQFQWHDGEPKSLTKAWKCLKKEPKRLTKARMCLKKARKEVRDSKEREAERGRLPVSHNNT
jgi:hypothetical protein